MFRPSCKISPYCHFTKVIYNLCWEKKYGYNQQNVRMKNEEPIMVAPLASKRARYLWRLLQLSISYQKNSHDSTSLTTSNFQTSWRFMCLWGNSKNNFFSFPKNATPLQFNIDTEHSDTFEKPFLLVHIYVIFQGFSRN